MTALFDLPALSVDVSVDDALDYMHNKNQSALVIMKGDNYGILRNFDVVNLKKRQERSGVMCTIGDASSKALKVARLDRFPNTQVSYRIVKDHGDSVTLESRLESYRDKIIFTKKVCFCGKCQHSCSEPHCTDGNICSNCRENQIQCY